MKNNRNKNQEMLLKVFGENLKFMRKTKNLTQEQLASLSGFTRSYYTEIETGKRNISLLNIYKLAESLDVDVTDFFTSTIDIKGDE